MRDEAFEFISQFAKNKDRTSEEAQRAYGIILERKRAIEGAQGLSYFAQGAFIHAIAENDLWKSIGEMEDWWTFGTFCKQRLGLSLSRAVTFQKIWEQSQWIGLLEEEIDQLGWVLASTIAKHCKSRDEVDQYLKFFEEGEKKGDLIEKIRQDHHAATKPKMNAMKLSISSTQKSFMGETLEIVAQSVNKKLGINIDQTECLMIALAQWREAYSAAGTRNYDDDSAIHQTEGDR